MENHSNIRLAIVISQINKALAFEWQAREFHKKGITPIFILLNNADSELESFLRSNSFLVFRLSINGIFGKSLSFLKLIKIFYSYRINVVHCHLFFAGILGLLASKFIGIKKRIYTRHYASQNLIFYPKAAKIDRFINILATHFIAPSEIVKQVLIEKENVPSHKISVVHHGFDFSYFQNNNFDFTQKYNPNSKQPIIGVIARYTELKGVHFIIEAFKKVLIEYPNALILLANSMGDYSKKIKTLLQEIPSQSFVEIDFEPQIESLYKMMDIYVHCPISSDLEAFGQTYVEALICKIPSVFTLSGVANEYIEHKKNAWVVSHKNSDEIAEGILSLLKDKELSQNIAKQGFLDVNALFQLDVMIAKTIELYKS
jgi:glycosyltransferase involved in cell wall biosynthesis